MDLDMAKRSGDLERMAEIEYSIIPKLEKKLIIRHCKMRKIKSY